MAYTTINDPSLYFRAKSYTGNGANNRAVVWDETHANMQADWLWFKSQSDSTYLWAASENDGHAAT